MGTSSSYRAPERPRWSAFIAALVSDAPIERVRSELFNAGSDWEKELSTPAVLTFAEAVIRLHGELPDRLAHGGRADVVLGEVIAEARHISTQTGFSAANALAERALARLLLSTVQGAADAPSGAIRRWEAARGSPTDLVSKYVGEVLGQYARLVTDRGAGRLTGKRGGAEASARLSNALAERATSIGTTAASEVLREVKDVSTAWPKIVQRAFEVGRTPTERYLVSEFAVVVNDCAAVATVGGPISIRSRNTPHGQRNFLFNLRHVTAGLPRQLNEREMDLAETAGHIFAIDIACARGKGDVRWARSIEAHLPVRDPDFWNAKALQIEAIFSDFTQDRLRLQFHADNQAAEPPRLRRKPFPAVDCVALISGGVDSFIGGVSLVRSGRHPLGLSHTAAGLVTSAQAHVSQVLSSSLPGFERVGFTAQKYGRTFPTPEPSQRSRSFLFLAVASVAAAAIGTEELFINENGIMAIHLPMTVARLGSLSTHTASPSVLERLQVLLGDIHETKIEIRNNLLNYTKPEVVELGRSLGEETNLESTVSCWSIGRTSRHCGTCTPCLMRRIRFELHAVDDIVYEVDAFEDGVVLENEMACDNMTHLVRAVSDLDVMSDLELQLSYPELLNGGTRLKLPDTIGLHRRWANQASNVLFNYPVPVMLR